MPIYGNGFPPKDGRKLSFEEIKRLVLFEGPEYGKQKITFPIEIDMDLRAKRKVTLFAVLNLICDHGKAEIEFSPSNPSSPEQNQSLEIVLNDRTSEEENKAFLLLNFSQNNNVSAQSYPITNDGAVFWAWGKRTDRDNIKGFPPHQFHLSLDNVVLLWHKAWFFQNIDYPILQYEYEKPVNHFSLINLENSSFSGARQMLKLLNEFKTFLYYQQNQRGGRKTGSRLKSSISRYNYICNHRYSRAWILKTDKEFLLRHPDIKQSELSRAKKWKKSGKPGL